METIKFPLTILARIYKLHLQPSDKNQIIIEENSN